jgi:thiosulfate reductase cytochrome b subunit
MEDKLIMKDATNRSILRWIHIVFSIPILGYIYSPFEEIPKYASRVRFVVVPVMLLSGLWMWKGHVIRRLISRRSAPPNETIRMKTGQELEG